ncbi:hypothetical protein BV898_07142 [Hypsibius exemplaris]|uniref:Uncharacterized protein n=1 Tax=Hypsibius exemplaris TaxID=2072580 RepID=A0A1W0WUJ9_HYPEX|nr:hypothetical protein BV898_07142 [Hypsibius exemplaris]
MAKFLCFGIPFHMFRINVLILIAGWSSSVLGVPGGMTAGQSQLLQIVAVPWLDRHPSDSHRLSHQSTTCSLSISPVPSETELNKGIFCHFKLGSATFIVRVALFNGRFCAIEVLRMIVDANGVQLQLKATTKLQFQVLDAKAYACGDSEAYIVLILTKDNHVSETQLLVFKLDSKDPLRQTFIIAHNSQLSTMRGVSDVSIRCFEDNVIFSMSASTTLLPVGSGEAYSSVRVWNPRSRSVTKQLIAETTNAVSVVAFESGRCLVIVFLQRSSPLRDGPIDSFAYCLMSDDRVGWRLTMIQRLNLCEVSGVELYQNTKQELGLFVAIANTAEEYPGCPRTSMSMKWTGKQFVSYGNVSMKGAADFYYLPTGCCNLVAARLTGAERALTFVGSTEPLFEDVHKLELISSVENNRYFLLVSFTSEGHHDALHELVCDQRVYKALPFSGFPPRYPYPSPPPPQAAMSYAAPPQMGFIGGGQVQQPPPSLPPPSPQPMYIVVPPLQPALPPPQMAPYQPAGLFFPPNTPVNRGNMTVWRPMPNGQPIYPPPLPPPMPVFNPPPPPPAPHQAPPIWMAPRPVGTSLLIEPHPAGGYRQKKRMHAFDEIAARRGL